MFFYRKDIFKENGIDVNGITTMQQWMDALETLKLPEGTYPASLRGGGLGILDELNAMVINTWGNTPYPKDRFVYFDDKWAPPLHRPQGEGRLQDLGRPDEAVGAGRDLVRLVRGDNAVRAGQGRDVRSGRKPVRVDLPRSEAVNGLRQGRLQGAAGCQPPMARIPRCGPGGSAFRTSRRKRMRHGSSCNGRPAPR